jgi:hypothetical protein
MLALGLPVAAGAVEISNGVPEGTVGHYRVDLDTGGQTRTAFITAARFASDDISTTEVVFDYSSLVDPGAIGGGDGESLFGSAPVVDPANPNVASSSGTFTVVNDTIHWTAVSSLPLGSQTMTTTYTFSTDSGRPLGPMRFYQYLDEDVQGAGDDVFFSTGTAAGGDLELFTFDNTDVYGISHSGALLPGADLQNATFAGSATDRFPNMRSLITGAGQPVAPTGIITNLDPLQHPQLGPVFGPADIVSTLAWDVDPNASTAVISTSLGGVPISALTVETRPIGNQLRCGDTGCRIQASCILPPGPSCANRVNLFVSSRALRQGGAAGKARVKFATAIGNVAPGQIGGVRLRLTSAGRSFVRSGDGTSTLRGVMRITNAAGSSDSIPVTLRVRH